MPDVPNANRNWASDLTLLRVDRGMMHAAIIVDFFASDRRHPDVKHAECRIAPESPCRGLLPLRLPGDLPQRHGGAIRVAPFP